MNSILEPAFPVPFSSNAGAALARQRVPVEVVVTTLFDNASGGAHGAGGETTPKR